VSWRATCGPRAGRSVGPGVQYSANVNIRSTDKVEVLGTVRPQQRPLEFSCVTETLQVHNFTFKIGGKHGKKYRPKLDGIRQRPVTSRER
jgi:hypothetical protein